MGAGNFHPDYVKINKNGTIPSLTSPDLAAPLIESADILEWLNAKGPSSSPSSSVDLVPKDEATTQAMKKLIDLVHGQDVSTNIILLEARDGEEMQAKQQSPFNDFVSARQRTLEDLCQRFPEDEFYQSRRAMNGALHQHYVSSDNHPEFFDSSHADYRGFAAGMDRLESLIVLPYAAGQEVTLADLHIVPWLAHAMWGAGTTQVDDFAPLEKLIQKTVPAFTVGPKTKQWWANMMQRESFKKVYPHLH